MADNNGRAKPERLKAPEGGIRVGGKFYREGRNLPERYRRRGEMHADPATGIPMAAPDFGRFVLPHPITFVGKQSTIAHIYRNPDEAVQRAFGQEWKMRRDPVIMAPLEARQRAVALLNWHLEVEDEKDPQQKELQTELTSIITRCFNFTEYRRCLLEAIWYGRYGVQHKFGFSMVGGKRRCVVKDWRPINGDKLVFRYDDGSGQYTDDEIGIKVTPVYGTHDALAGDRILEMTDRGMAYFLEPWERSMIAIHRHIIEDGDYDDPISAGRVQGVGVRDRIWWCWYQKQETMAQMMEVIDRTGSGITIYWYPAGDNSAKEEMLDLAEKQRHENVLVMPRMSGDPTGDAYGIERVEPTATGMQMLKEVVHEFFGHQIVRYIAGQTLSSESQAMGIGSGAADFQSETWGQIVRYDAIKLEETITHELIDRALKPFNFPWAADIPVWFRVDTQSPESHKKLEAIKYGWDMGLRVKASDVMDVIGLSLPGDDDETLQNPALIQQARLAAQQWGEGQGQGQPGMEQGDGIPNNGIGDGQDELRDLFGPLADLVMPQTQGGEVQQGGGLTPGGLPPGGIPTGEPAQGAPGPARYAKKKSSPGQANFLWKEELHPREKGGEHGGEFAEKEGGQPEFVKPGMDAHDWMEKLAETHRYSDSPTAQSVRQHLFETLHKADVHPEQLAAMLSGDKDYAHALHQHAAETGQHEPAREPQGPFALMQQKAKLGAGAGAGGPPPTTQGKQEAFFHGMGDKPGQSKLFEGLDLAGGTPEVGNEPDSQPEQQPPVAETSPPPAPEEEAPQQQLEAEPEMPSAPAGKSPDKDAADIAAAVGGDEDARGRILTKYDKIIRAAAYHDFHVDEDDKDFDDIVQHGLLALNEAINRFDPGLGFKFSTFARKFYKLKIKDKLKSIRKLPLAGDVVKEGAEGQQDLRHGNREKSPVTNAIENEHTGMLRKAIEDIRPPHVDNQSEQSKKAVEAKYEMIRKLMTGTMEGDSQADMADKFGISKQWINDLIKIGRKHLSEVPEVAEMQRYSKKKYGRSVYELFQYVAQQNRQMRGKR